MLRFILLLTQALTGHAALPSLAEQTQALLARQGVCEADWKNLATEVGTQTFELEPGTKLTLVPCALWAYNLAWTAYVTVDGEPAFEKQILFTSYRAGEGLLASAVAHNLRWDAANQTLQSAYHPNGKEHCGSVAFYRWRPVSQSFSLEGLAHQDDCQNPDGTWERLYPAN